MSTRTHSDARVPKYPRRDEQEAAKRSREIAMAAEKARLEKARDAASDTLSAAIEATKRASEAYEQSRLDLLAAEQSKVEAAVCKTLVVDHNRERYRL